MALEGYSTVTSFFPSVVVRIKSAQREGIGNFVTFGKAFVQLHKLNIILKSRVYIFLTNSMNLKPNCSKSAFVCPKFLTLTV